jgi:hypothetical protein
MDPTKAEPPEPAVTDFSVSPTDTVTRGDPITIRVSVTNDGGTADWQSIAIPLPLIRDRSAVSIASHDLDTVQIATPGEQINANYGRSQTTVNYIVVEGSVTGWENGETHHLEVQVVPEGIGPFTIYAKSVAQQSETWVSAPDRDSSASTDQQSEHVFEHSLEVVPGDQDGDGLSDVDDPCEQKTDCDGDGLSDREEAESVRTHPEKADTDSDGLSDGREHERLDTEPLESDTDSDGLDDGAEFDRKTDPTESDTDGDEISDGREANDPTDPTKADTDSDGYDDNTEVQRGTDPTDANSHPTEDADGDGLPDSDDPCLEKSNCDGDGWTDDEDPTPRNANADDEWRPDGADGEGSSDADGDGTPNFRDEDNDGDGLADGTDPSVVSSDADGDGVADGRERGVGTDPKVKDTDGDGLDDAAELQQNSDPTNPNSHPESDAESSTQSVERVGTDGELTVAPGTDVMLVVSAPDYDGEYVRTEWTIRGGESEETRRPLGPFHSWYQGDGRD